ncbi:ABC transporter permease [Aestuariicella hydrocarbonica]|uniref:ABC transporter permease n=1 Tax=Pseudomaricurvus hydrocarbonicus TaxID=1470433 RepID=A0A9E5MNJ4_9GAMM|nr:ABC transporter permease [Aestuariicella hydrocarbonica]NHO67556.1 ABC transporter permease [Aestuariicella hydrocarbonica]
MTLTQTLTADDFAPLAKAQHPDQIVRPSLSYWQDAWRRLQRNRRAMWSLYLIAALLLFSYVLPFVVPFDAVGQDLTQISQAPSLEKKSLVVDTQPWPGQQVRPAELARLQSAPFDPATRVTGLTLVGEANTESVRLAWQPVAGAKAYQVYRHLLVPSGATDLGLPLGQTEQPEQVSYEDRLKLQNMPYYYSVRAVADTGEVSDYATVKATPRLAISVRAALSRGLITADQTDSMIGREVELQRHLMGTDYLGRDLLARLVYGGQTSLFIGIVAPLLFVAMGIVYGGLSGYLGGRTDEVMMRFADFVIALPFLLFMILFRVAMGIGPGESGVTPMLIAMVLLGWPTAAKLVRGQVLQLREQPFVEAAQLMGANSRYLILRHMLPNVMGVVLVSLTFSIPSAIFTEAFLSFIGMGVAPPTPSWGAMCNDGVKSFMSHPHELLFPALFISLTVLAFNLLGDGLRDALDAKMKG